MLQGSPTELVASFERQRQAFALDPDPTLATRLSRLDRLAAWLDSHEPDIVRAIDADFQGRSAHETRLAEVFVVRAGIRHARRHLKQWMRTQRVPTALHFRPGYNRLMPQPLGVVGIIAPWNYPLQLSLGPALAALAAGNRVLIKPSELTPRLSALLASMAREIFNPDELDVAIGDVELGKAFASLPFDHLFFTGSTQVGRDVAQAAAANLTPVTLELGGKSPAILDVSCNVAVAAQRIAFGKLLNAGQTCVAPDYLLVPTGTAENVASHLERAITKLYPNLTANPDYTAIISERHRARLAEMVREARTAGARVIEVNPAGEVFNAASRKLPPTLVIGAPAATRLMREEIFGPVLPIVEYANLDDALAYVQRNARPLALYWFGDDASRCNRALRETVSGGVTINDCLWHLAQESQPFGGVGPSGMGAYHGKWGFDTFSKRKPVFHQTRWNGTALFHPPYGHTFNWLLRVLSRIA
ncbi:coniferyl aldehyde dehydrogenase [Ralstonia pickettii]|uniref:coniferyl aldehyde dehydrogenase n=1 Tax=Ralstonia pickettii TaxID=329 RepID=UPI0015FDDAFA|nr:coniferyl aldehyde dehydrogenase [Ralstonia pickettii]MBB0026675.1 coniferyl aldehyde dehydrogenase [Ralstonia pickettii]MBB0037463.1 coniferyl aldehyde dehydrogenase [Ralstonia pickettii]MBB0099750.1 coniferyl aldehyde dehydrogenase [Ralstonia pickettii]MBB0109709.1 coniferyl aldehyde dehydrogenase [Ralstonia pickettii]MBB0130777.1 coniferyl aldehyde dehydrogenase [Ralstonia pickettii]